MQRLLFQTLSQYRCFTLHNVTLIAHYIFEIYITYTVVRFHHNRIVLDKRHVFYIRCIVLWSASVIAVLITYLEGISLWIVKQSSWLDENRCHSYRVLNKIFYLRGTRRSSIYPCISLPGLLLWLCIILCGIDV